MASRDTDISTNITSTTAGTPPVGMDFSPMSLQEEADAEGWTRITRPAGGTPPDAMTAGTRGASDEAVGDKDSPASGYE